MRRYRYVTLDVFTDRAFGGNPLAVLLDAQGLSGDEMQAIAAEFNYSETTFVLPPENPAHTARVRIFTPKAEMPFAGHPNVGTAFALATQSEEGARPRGSRLLFEEIAGLVPVDILREDDAPVGAMLTTPKALERRAELPLEAVAACAGLATQDVVTEHHRPLLVSIGVTFAIAEVTPRALSLARPSAAAFGSILPLDKAAGLHLYARGEPRLRTRMFSPLQGIAEDPATGSANAGLAALLAELDPAIEGEYKLDIVQGVEMGRPSRLESLVSKRAGKAETIRIGGRCVAMMAGILAWR